MTSMKALEGKVAVVTGAGQGIGAAVAIELARQGAKIVINDIGAKLDGTKDSQSTAQDVLKQIQALGSDGVINTDSVAEAASASRIVQQALDSFGRIDVVVNNAGILRDVIFHKMEIKDFESVIGVHLFGSFYVSRAAAEHFRKQESGAYVHMTSTSGLIGNYGQANYAAAKLGIAALSKSIALDLKRYNVRSNCIAPFAWTRMTASIPTDTPEQRARVEKLKPMTSEKVGIFAAFLASDLAKDVTGQIFAVRNNEIFLFNQPRPIRSIHRSEGWTVESLAEHGVAALKPSFMPLDVTKDIFSWDSV